MSKNSSNGMKRRDFLKLGALSGLVASTAGLSACTNGKSVADFKGKAKYIIFLVTDGMSSGTLQLADLMRRRKEGRTSKWIDLYEKNLVHRGLMDMTTANSNVPDSAASASAWGCGVLITNGRVCMSDEGESYTPILPLFKENGFATGLVTTARVTHATPAAFSANVMERGMEDEIASQQLEREIDIILGGGNEHFSPDRREDNRDLYNDFFQKNYHVAKTKAEMLNAPEDNEKVLGIFSDSHLPYTLDQMSTPDLMRDVPTLAEMTEFAINKLYNTGKGFVMQVEGARVDHAAHSMDASGLIYDQIAFDDAIEKAWDFYNQHPDETLIFITTDHGNANPALNAAGSRYNDSVPMFDKLQHVKYTNNWILSQLRDIPVNERNIIEVVEEATRIQISREHAQLIRQSFNDEYNPAYSMRRTRWATLSDVLANHFSVTFTGSVHTADYVELAAVGPGIETLTSFTQSTDLFKLMCEAAGVSVPQYANA